MVSKQRLVYTDIAGQNIYKKVKQSSKTGQIQKSLISAFVELFFAKSFISKREISIEGFHNVS